MTVPVAYGPLAAAALLLVAGGALKLARPGDTANALAALGWPGARVLVRAGAAAEVVVGATVLAAGGRIAPALVAVSYAGFAVFVVAALRKDTPVASCGCFGEVDAPPTIVHAVLCAASAAAAGFVAASGAPSLTSVLSHQPWHGLPLVVLTGLAAYLAFLVMAVLPRTMAAARNEPQVGP
jgi:hypothetical protein